MTWLKWVWGVYLLLMILGDILLIGEPRPTLTRGAVATRVVIKGAFLVTLWSYLP